MAGVHHPTRGGTRGGGDQFDWDDVKVDKYRENYLGHSLKAPVGRWQKGKDLTWYTKQSKMAGKQEKLKAEVAAIKRAEEEAMAAALGLKPSTAQTKPQQALTKQEIAEVCRRKSVEEMDEGDERIKGIGFQSRRSQILYSGGDSTTTKDGATVFEHDQSQCSNDDRLKMSEGRKRAAPPTTPTTPLSQQTLAEVTSPKEPIEQTKDEKETAPAIKKKKHKKEKKKKTKKVKKLKQKHRHDSESSESEEVEWTERQIPAAGSSKSHFGNGHPQTNKKRKRHDSLHSEEEWTEKKPLSDKMSSHHDARKQERRHSSHDNKRQEYHSGRRKRSPVVGDSHRRRKGDRESRREYSDDSSDDCRRRGAKRRERSREREERNHGRQKRSRHDTYTDSD